MLLLATTPFLESSCRLALTSKSLDRTLRNELEGFVKELELLKEQRRLRAEAEEKAKALAQEKAEAEAAKAAEALAALAARKHEGEEAEQSMVAKKNKKKKNQTKSSNGKEGSPFDRLSKEDPEEAEAEEIEEIVPSLPFHVVKDLSAFLLNNKDVARKGDKESSSTYHLHELLKGSQMVFPKPKKAPRNPELVARLKRLRAEVENKEYNRMVGNIADTPDKYNYHADIREVREESKKITGVVNVLFTAGGVFGAVFVLSSHVFSEIGWRVLFSLFCTFVATFAESWLFVKYGKL